MASNDLSRINTNIQAMNALNALNNVNAKMGMHQLRLATGKRINSAADDAAGFTIASKLKVKSKGLGTALDNIGSAKNLMTVAEGHLSNIKDILTEMKSKAQQAANDTLGTEERTAILAELEQFNSQIDAEVAQAQWSNSDILSTDKTFQIGVGTASSDSISFNVAEDVWQNGTSTTFNSAGLNVQASTTAARTAATTSQGSSNISIGDSALATSSTIQSLASELDNGHYTVEITSTGGGSAAGSGALTFQLRDSNGDLVTIDADGAAGAGSVGTTLTTTFDGADGAPALVDLGVGITVDLTSVATASAAAGTATIHFDYTNAGSSVSTMQTAQDFMDQVDTAINNVTSGLGYIGGMINRLSFQEESLTVAKTNTEAAHSRIVDADMAWEQLEATKMMILQQTATAMLSQANTAPQSILSLFG
jgi:flagellin